MRRNLFDNDRGAKRATAYAQISTSVPVRAAIVNNYPTGLNPYVPVLCGTTITADYDVSTGAADALACQNSADLDRGDIDFPSRTQKGRR